VLPSGFVRTRHFFRRACPQHGKPNSDAGSGYSIRFRGSVCGRRRRPCPTRSTPADKIHWTDMQSAISAIV
jgi:hypothetical protein